MRKDGPGVVGRLEPARPAGAPWGWIVAGALALGGGLYAALPHASGPAPLVRTPRLESYMARAAAMQAAHRDAIWRMPGILRVAPRLVYELVPSQAIYLAEHGVRRLDDAELARYVAAHHALYPRVPSAFVVADGAVGTAEFAHALDEADEARMRAFLEAREMAIRALAEGRPIRRARPADVAAAWAAFDAHLGPEVAAKFHRAHAGAGLGARGYAGRMYWATLAALPAARAAAILRAEDGSDPGGRH